MPQAAEAFVWTPTREAALAQARRVDARAYGRTRNHLDGAVTRLSPWITHGFVDLPELYADARERLRASSQDKLVFEYAWREFFHHVWRHAGEGILSDLRSGLQGVRYASTLPDDLLTASTGVPVIDATVRALYATGWVHNHARMWLASYVVHVRKVHWRAGADWMYAYLLDGDLASNHLSWQWVAGTFSHKPYLFNADNVARHAPAALHSPGTVIDTGYDVLDALARAGDDAGPEPERPAPLAPPPVFTQPPEAAGPPPETAPLDPTRFAARRVALVHPWHLRRPEGVENALGVLHAPFHARFPWSAQRWRFVLDGMRTCVDAVWFGEVAQAVDALRDAGQVQTVANLNPGWRELPAVRHVQMQPAPRFTDDPERPCASFSAFWTRVSRALR
jgi:deoxyribodipyrimidine photo-lyase